MRFLGIAARSLSLFHSTRMAKIPAALYFSPFFLKIPQRIVHIIRRSAYLFPYPHMDCGEHPSCHKMFSGKLSTGFGVMQVFVFGQTLAISALLCYHTVGKKLSTSGKQIQLTVAGGRVLFSPAEEKYMRRQRPRL